jgi:hypothetical protein
MRDRIEAAIGEPVITAQSMTGGYSPGLAARLTTESGRRLFAKAVSNQRNPIAPSLHRREIVVASRLPAEAPVPPLLWSWKQDDGEEWAVLVFENVDGHPPAQPWLAHEFDRVVDALNALSADLTPSPLPVSEIGDVARWNPLAGGHWFRAKVRETPGIDPWAIRNLDRLIEIEDRVATLPPGETLLHLDLRGDNMLLTEEGVVIVDWPHARIGPAWLDGVFFAPSVAMEGGPQPEDLIPRLDAMRTADPDHLTIGIVAIAGFFTYEGAQAPVEGLPGLREFQEAQGAVARRWVARRTGWK